MGKAKSGKSKSGKGKKGKKGDDEQMSMRESILAYKINLKEQLLEDLNYEAESLQKKIEKGQERNLKLKDEQLGHLTLVVREVKAEEEGDKRDPISGRASIESALHDLWLTDQKETKDVAGIKKHIAELDGEISEEMVVFNKWNDYKEYGQHEDEHRVAVLEDELRDNQATFDEQSKFHQEDLAKCKREVGSFTDKTVENVKDGAAEKAMAKMDKKERREITDHSWLKHEAVRYRGEVEKLEEEVRRLEQHNLHLMSKLFDCRMEDLNISRKFFLTQFDEETVFAKGAEETVGIIEHDLITNHPLLRPSPFAPQLANQKLPIESQIVIESETSYASLTKETTAPHEKSIGTLMKASDSTLREDDRTSGYSSMAPYSILSDSVKSVPGRREVGQSKEGGVGGGVRPKSSTLKAIEEKVFGIVEEDEDLSIEDDDEGIDLDDSRNDIDEELGLQAGEGLANNLVDNYFNLEDDSKDEYLKLGPLELKMLQVVGNQIPMRSPTPPTQEELELQAYNPDEWPVTHKMLQSIQAESLQLVRNRGESNAATSTTVGKNTSVHEKDTSIVIVNTAATATASSRSKTGGHMEAEGYVASHRTSQQLTTGYSVSKLREEVLVE